MALYLLWQALALIKGSVGGPLELTLLRSPVVSLLQSDLEMQLGTGLKRCRAASNLNPSPKPNLIRTLTLAPTLILTREWARVSLELSSTRELRYKKLSAPPLEAAVAMRDATEVRVGDNL